MRFRLVYQGRLPASGNSPKPTFVRDIRDQFHGQLKALWESHIALKHLLQRAIVLKEPDKYIISAKPSPFYEERDIEKCPPQDHEVDLCAQIARGTQRFMPLVRKSLNLNCELNVLFLRKEDPGALVLQGGDIDNRIKLLFDALKVPDVDEATKHPQAQDLTYCLMESDSLIFRFDIDSDRLLFPKDEKIDEVFLVIEVVIRVLKVAEWNMALL
jgi:hypothetical protein